MKKHMCLWKNLFIRIYENEGKWGKHMQDAEHLAEEL